MFIYLNIKRGRCRKIHFYIQFLSEFYLHLVYIYIYHVNTICKICKGKRKKIRRMHLKLDFVAKIPQPQKPNNQNSGKP